MPHRPRAESIAEYQTEPGPPIDWEGRYMELLTADNDLEEATRSARRSVEYLEDSGSFLVPPDTPRTRARCIWNIPGLVNRSTAFTESPLTQLYTLTHSSIVHCNSARSLFRELQDAYHRYMDGEELDVPKWTVNSENLYACRALVERNENEAEYRCIM
jgi:hypothetical protein